MPGGFQASAFQQSAFSTSASATAVQWAQAIAQWMQHDLQWIQIGEIVVVPPPEEAAEISTYNTTGFIRPHGVRTRLAPPTIKVRIL